MTERVTTCTHRACTRTWSRGAITSSRRASGPESRNAGVHVVSSKNIQLFCVFFSVSILAGCGDFAMQDTDSLLIPSFRRSEVIGIVAGFGTDLCRFARI